MGAGKPVQVERIEYPQRSFRSRMSWLGLRMGAYPVIAAWSRSEEKDWPYHLFDEVAGRIVPPVAGNFREPVQLPNCDAELQIPRGARSDRAILYLHGGAFIIGGLASHRRLAGSIAANAEAQVLAVGYRKMPDYPPSVSVQDCVDGYLWLLERGFTPEQIVIAGDSAGGFLTAMTAVMIRDKGMPRPAGLILENPLIDPTPSRRREGAYRVADPLFPHRAFTEFDKLIRQTEPAGDAVAPLDGDLSGLPPTLIQVGSHETLRVDSEDFAAALAAVGVPVRLEIYRGAVHVFQAFIDLLPESRVAIKAMARFAVQCYGDAGWSAAP
ncbi:putative carboxylesterase [Gordonia hirsuta DSM 44140 = NBRC 16056]|uniref:Putative carboxylesterase n=1 Tax=Gordonia hirsuta DSM 44140 = NBRC 16056 TaxID=1121927 RepID=L7L964_9ACTN|nr:alpha/beta hydrolase [Gordonia hirsuta]GAC56563.1 putative carboxylesterase [Gordonia hirsuta DSM 44140 = NBRC 16056]